MAVLNPLKVIITNRPSSATPSGAPAASEAGASGGFLCTVPDFPFDPSRGSHTVLLDSDEVRTGRGYIHKGWGRARVMFTLTHILQYTTLPLLLSTTLSPLNNHSPRSHSSSSSLPLPLLLFLSHSLFFSSSSLLPRCTSTSKTSASRARTTTTA